MSALDDAFTGDLFPEARGADLTLTLRLYGTATPKLLDELKVALTEVLIAAIKAHGLDGGTVELDAPGVEDAVELAMAVKDA